MLSTESFKKFFIYTLVFSIVICALVAVVSVLIGEFTDTLGRVLLTLGLIVLHSFFALFFVWDTNREGAFSNFSFFTDSMFFIIVLSFLSSVLGAWDIFSGDLLFSCYEFYFVLAFAALHGNILYKATEKENYIDLLVILNYVFMALVVIMLGIVIFVTNPTSFLPDLFFRILGAASIIDGTLSILVLLFYKLYLSRHPKDENPLLGYPQENVPKEQRSGLSIWVWILIIYLIVQIFFGFFIRSFFNFF
jgi:hypothetical protein